MPESVFVNGVHQSLSTTDIVICVVYLASVVLVGLVITWLSSGRNSSTINGYYLGNKCLPWWALAIADVSSYIDLAGTMLNTALLYALGIKGMLIEIRGGLCLMLAFQLTLTGKLIKRCPVRTRGEWIRFRFGDDLHGKCARTAVAILSMLTGVMGVAYFAIAGGKFISEFIRITPWLGLPAEFWSSGFLMLIALVYTVIAGFTTIVYTDVYQSVFIFFAFIIVSVLGLQVNLPEEFTLFLPKWNYLNSTDDFDQYRTSKSEWQSIKMPSNLHLPESSSFSIYNMFSMAIFFYLTQQCLRSSSGPGGGGLQTVLATKSEKEVRSQTLLAMFLMVFRWAFSAGIAVLAIEYSVQNPGISIDPERVLPVVICEVLPNGVKGIILAALLAAALTTFDSGINSASSYWTIDIYQALLNPSASDKSLVLQARLSTIVILVGGLFLSLYVKTINHVWGFMTMALGGGSTWPYFLSWYWSRFNGVGYCCGLLSGFLAATVILCWFPHITDYYAFLCTSSTSLFVSLCTCLISSPTKWSTLVNFHKKVRPPGIWSRVAECHMETEEINVVNKENRADVLCACGMLVLQVCIYFFAVSFVINAWTESIILCCAILSLMYIMHKYWDRHLCDRLFKPSLYESLLGEI